MEKSKDSFFINGKTNWKNNFCNVKYLQAFHAEVAAPYSFSPYIRNYSSISRGITSNAITIQYLITIVGLILLKIPFIHEGLDSPLFLLHYVGSYLIHKYVKTPLSLTLCCITDIWNSIISSIYTIEYT